MNDPRNETPSKTGWFRGLNLWTAVVVLFTGGVLAWQSHTLGLTTDEVSYIQCHEKLEAWLRDVRREGLLPNLDQKRLAEGWYFGQFYNKNLPLIGWMSLVSEGVFGSFDNPLAAYRWGNVILFAATAGLVFRWVAGGASIAAGLVGAASLVGMPRLAANGALMSLDPLIGALWIWGTWCLTRCGKGWGYPIALAVITGLGFATKPTFWFMIPIWVGWGVYQYRRESWRLIAAMILVGGLTAYVVLPMWWTDPIGGLWNYWKLLRAESGWQGVDAYYLGNVYQVAGQGKAPWHAVIVLTLVTTPVWILVLWVLGIVRWLRELGSDEPRLLWGIGFCVLPLVMMLPGTPCHDGVRMFLPSLMFGGILAGSGASSLLESRKWRREWLPTALGGIALLISPLPLVLVQPAGLSYYNVLTGGLQGATEAGKPNGQGLLSAAPTFEATYWWEVMTDENWRAMQEQIPAGKSVWIYPDFIGKELLKRWGVLRGDLKFAGTPREADFLLLYGRMGRLMQGESHPMEVWFQSQPGVWEVRVRGARLAVLIPRQ